MSDLYLVRVGEGADSRWLDGMGPGEMMSLTVYRGAATAYTIDQAAALVNRIVYSVPWADPVIEPVGAMEGEELLETRRRGQG